MKILQEEIDKPADEATVEEEVVEAFHERNEEI